MKQRITFITDTERPTAPLLLHFSIILHQMRLNPVVFTLEACPERGEDTVWQIVLRDGPNFAEFLIALKGTEGVQHLATTVIPDALPADPSPVDAPPVQSVD